MAHSLLIRPHWSQVISPSSSLSSKEPEDGKLSLRYRIVGLEGSRSQGAAAHVLPCIGLVRCWAPFLMCRFHPKAEVTCGEGVPTCCSFSLNNGPR